MMLGAGFMLGVIFIWVVCMFILEMDDRMMLHKSKTHEPIRVKNQEFIVLSKREYETMKGDNARGKQNQTINLLI